MMPPLANLAEGVPHGDYDSADQSRGPLAVGARGRPQAQRGCPHRYLLPSAPCAYPLVWPVILAPIESPRRRFAERCYGIVASGARLVARHTRFIRNPLLSERSGRQAR